MKAFQMMTVAVTATAILGGAGLGCMTEDGGDPALMEQHQAISDCGGFVEWREPVFATDGYCDAERLEWTYDAATATLELRNTRVELNCCGERSARLEQVDGVYVMHETDEEGVEGRCLCMCVFDYGLTVVGMGEATIPLRLERGGVVWEGDLDLAAGAGTVVIDDTPVEMGCEGI